MKTKNIVLLTLLMISKLALSQKNDIKQVKQTFENYLSSLSAENGASAVKYLDQNTINYYELMAELSKNADSLKIESLSILDKIMVLSIRHRTTKEDIKSLDGKTLLIYAIDNGMIGKNNIQNIAIGKVTIDKTKAKGQIVSD